MSMVRRLEQCHDAHAQALFAYLLNLTSNEVETQDILQEVFLRLAARPQLLETARDPRRFLLRMAHNFAIDPTGPSIRMHESGEDRASRARYHSWNPYNVFAAMLLSALDRSHEKAVASQATVTLAHVACALDRHRLAHAQYPETLEELVPRFLPRVPPDPVNGGPLRYRRDDPDRFILYSIGLNQQDDGGVAAAQRRGPFGRGVPSGDWVWRSHPVAVGDLQDVVD